MPTTFMRKLKTDNVIQVFGLRLIDWRRMTDCEAGQYMTNLVNRIGVDAFNNALRCVRSLAGKPRLLRLSAICGLGHPELPNLIKNPPKWDDDETWRTALAALILDERRKEEQAWSKQLIDQAIEEQAQA